MLGQRDSPECRSVVVSYVQLYKDLVQDLLTPAMSSVQLREDTKIGVYLQGCEELVVHSAEDCIGILALADNRCALLRHNAQCSLNKTGQ